MAGEMKNLFLSIADTLRRALFFQLRRRSMRQQAASQLRNLRLWDLERNGKGHIAVGDVSLVDLVEHYGSPLMVVNKACLEKDVISLIDAFRQAPVGSRVLYSYKTNCIPGILKQIHTMGVGAEVISPYELFLAEKLGVPGHLIVYNGVHKTLESIERAIRLNILAINVDHFEEIDRIYRIAEKLGQKVRVGVRLGLVSSSQFGMALESGEAMKACRKIAALSSRLELSCVHFNVTSHARSADIHKECALRAMEFIAEVKQELGITIDYLDIGGGFGVPTTKQMSKLEYGIYRSLSILPKPPSPGDCKKIEEIMAEIIESINEICISRKLKMPKLLIEPGRIATSRAEILLFTVHAIKKKPDGNMFAITDAGRFSIAYPCEFEYHEIFIANRHEDPMKYPYQIMGRICTSADWMFKNRYLPELYSGDILAVMDAGAYFSSFSSNFAFQRPAIIMVDQGHATLLRKEETFDYLIAMDGINKPMG